MQGSIPIDLNYQPRSKDDGLMIVYPDRPEDAEVHVADASAGGSASDPSADADGAAFDHAASPGGAARPRTGSR
jgi:hypothetical protein